MSEPIYPTTEIREAAERTCRYTHTRECLKCHGTGEICGRHTMLECWPCDGTGEIEETKIDRRKLAGLRKRAAKAGWEKAIADTIQADDSCSGEVAENRCWSRFNRGRQGHCVRA